MGEVGRRVANNDDGFIYLVLKLPPALSDLNTNN